MSDEKPLKIVLPERPRPHSITFFTNGQTCVGDQFGRQMGQFQDSHEKSIDLLKKAGYDWKDLPDILGSPRSIL